MQLLQTKDYILGILFKKAEESDSESSLNVKELAMQLQKPLVLIHAILSELEEASEIEKSGSSREPYYTITNKGILKYYDGGYSKSHVEKAIENHERRTFWKTLTKANNHSWIPIFVSILAIVSTIFFSEIRNFLGLGKGSSSPIVHVKIPESNPQITVSPILQYPETKDQDGTTSPKTTKKNHEDTASPSIPVPQKPPPPISKTIPNRWKKYIGNDRIQNTTNGVTYAVLIKTAGTNEYSTSSAYVAQSFQSKGAKVTTSLFSHAFFEEGAFEDVLNGAGNLFASHNLYEYVDKICLGTITMNYRGSGSQANMRVCELTLVCSILSAKDGSFFSSLSESTRGTGWSDTEAKANAYKKLQRILDHKLSI